jgi:3-oxoacyl-[acyl-carrier-protein] synthase III
MGAHIDAAAALTSHGMRRPSARRLADAAAQACLARAGRQAGDIDMLINAGVYREDHLGEPALAALVQEDIGANLGQPPVGGHGTFSFDVANGTCGVISALKLQAGLLRSGVIKLGLTVASDVEPSAGQSRSVLIQPTGGAVLLGWDDSIAGFTDFYSETFPEYEDMLVSGLEWQPRRGVRVSPTAAGESRLVIRERPGYLARCVDCAEEATRRFLDRLGMDITEIDLLVPAPSAPEFLDSLRVRLGAPGDRVSFTAEDMAGAYTAATIAALEAATKSGRLAEARETLLLAVGAGITVALALYRQAPPQPGHPDQDLAPGRDSADG